MKKKTIFNTIISLWSCIDKSRYLQFLFLLILMISSVIAELLSIGSVIPFLGALTNPERLMEFDWIQPILHLLKINSSSQLLLPLTIIFISIAIISAFIRILLLWVNTRLSASIGVELRREVFAKTLFQPYEYHLEHNSSHLVSMATEKVGIVINGGILQVLMFVSALFISIAIIGMLLFLNPVIALSTFFLLGVGYILIGFLVRNSLKTSGIIVAENQPVSVRLIQEGLGGIRDIIMDGTQQVFINHYSKVAYNIQTNEAKISFIGSLPKSVLEVMGITLIAILAYVLQTGTTSGQQAIPILGALALGAQRLMPALQQMYFSWSRVNSIQPTIEEVVSLLKQPIDCHNHQEKSKQPVTFNNDITLKNIEFKYKNTETYVLKSINLEITKGSKIGFIGETGSGKSTLLDICMGLLIPTNGTLTVDGVEINQKNLKEWQSNITHVPQNIFLSDASIAENIAFGITSDYLDLTRVKKVAKLASLNEFVEGLAKGYSTKVGERGVQLSGGQRQRIGIARALYKKAEVIVLDEATSALDTKTEANVMQAINLLDDNLTVFIIAHRLTTLINCDTVFKLDSGTIVESGSYQQMIS